jgi:serine protease Do
MPALGLIEVGTEMGTANGTGWVVSPGGWVITCAHVVESTIWMRFIAEGESAPRSLELVAVDEEGDLALLRLTDGAGSPHWLPLANEGQPPSLGDEVAILGYPLGKQLGLTLTYTQGIVNSVRESSGVSMIQVDAGAAPGSSGGPVFRRADGSVLGVLSSGLHAQGAGMLINFASGVQRLRNLGWIAR